MPNAIMNEKVQSISITMKDLLTYTRHPWNHLTI